MVYSLKNKLVPSEEVAVEGGRAVVYGVPEVESAPLQEDDNKIAFLSEMSACANSLTIPSPSTHELTYVLKCRIILKLSIKFILLNPCPPYPLADFSLSVYFY